MDPKGTQFLLLFFIFLCTQGSKFNGDSIPGCIPIERSALLEFKEGLKVPSSRLLSWVGEECCTWEGVTCDNRTGHVVKLDLHNPHPLSINGDLRNDRWSLGGELRPSLLNLKHLNYLDLSMNNFGGICIPEFLGSFHQLKYLNLSRAGFGGLIPHQLGNLSSLQYLDLSGDIDGNLLAPFNEISIDNARWISHLSSLRYLNMGSVNVTEGANWLQALNMLPFIVVIDLSSCDINTIPLSLPHVNFTSLSILDLSGNFIDSAMPGWLFNISSLECLYLRGDFTRVFIPPAIKNLASLKELDLSGSSSIEGKIPSELGELCKLQYLDLSGSNITEKLHEFDEVFNGCIKNSLETLIMEHCQLSGYLPNGLGDFRMLKHLSLLDNSISGPIPASLGRLSSLQQLDLSFNKLNGTPPGSLGRLAEIVELDLGSNFLDGVISEEHFANLTKLKDLDLSDNQLILKVGPDWIPPFQLQSLGIGSCKLGPRFPAWLRMQENISELGMSSTGISDTIPDWFWRLFSRIEFLDISGNGISGSLPDLTDFINLYYFDVSSNYFEGPLPNFPSFVLDLFLSNNSFSGVIHLGNGKSMPRLQILSLSRNKLSGEIPSSLCQLNMYFLDLSKNLLVGEIPNCWNSPIMVMDFSSNYLSGSIPNCWNRSSYIMVMDFSNNNLSGSIPPICSSRQFESLHLSNNNLSGEFPLSLKGCESLVTLDLGQNGFTGTLPTWIGASLLSLRVFRLRSNKLVGNIPSNLSRLSALQILDLACNNLSGTIPLSFGNFTAMKVSQEHHRAISFEYHTGYKENMQVIIKGTYNEYDILLPYVIIMDLSNNNLSGRIPEELTSLFGLMSLNLSGNHLIGEIPKKISALQWLESLDLARNNLSGEIPSSMIALTFLSYLNLSCNNLSGKIPSGNQFETFTDPSIYADNPGLYGFPLTQKSKDEETKDGQNDNAMDEEGSEMKWVYLSMGPGFVVGFWTVFGPLLFSKRWREAYFRFIDKMYDIIYVALAVAFNIKYIGAHE